MKKKKNDKYFLKEIIISKIICPVIFVKKKLKIIEGKSNYIFKKNEYKSKKRSNQFHCFNNWKKEWTQNIYYFVHQFYSYKYE